jgi:hypothetical protein
VDFFLGESSIVALCSNIFENFGQNEMKSWNLHSTLPNPKNFYQKNKCSIPSGLYKRWNIQCYNPNYPKKTIIMDLFSSIGVGNEAYNFVPTHIEVL